MIVSEVEAGRVNTILKQYEDMSGQVVNYDKTTVSFSRGVGDDQKRTVAGLMGVRVVIEQDKYLGLPTSIGRSKQGLTRIVRAKLSKKLQGWRGMLFSKAGREILIKAVAQSIPTYAVSVFKFPSNFYDDLRSFSRNFGEARTTARGNFRGWLGRSCVSPSIWEVSVSEIMLNLTWLCWASRFGVFLRIVKV
ncbi:hypothetical protein RND81_06G173300 [Saponaria officinalis]|uniref:Reverse transcriptase n=1 Tax=Saponaria officinalis TaxID=3572 RepID=A0AAW1KE97_SAPOF